MMEKKSKVDAEKAEATVEDKVAVVRARLEMKSMAWSTAYRLTRVPHLLPHTAAA